MRYHANTATSCSQWPYPYDGNGQGTGKSAGNNHPSVVKPFDYSYAHVRHNSLLLFERPSILPLHLQVCTETATTQVILLHGTRCWNPLVGKSNRQIQRGKPVVQRWLTFLWITSIVSTLLYTRSAWVIPKPS